MCSLARSLRSLEPTDPPASEFRNSETRLSESDGGQGSQNKLGIHRAPVPVMTGASLEAPQYDLPDLPQYHLLELRGRRGKERWKAKNIKPLRSLRLCGELLPLLLLTLALSEAPHVALCKPITAQNQLCR